MYALEHDHIQLKANTIKKSQIGYHRKKVHYENENEKPRGNTIVLIHAIHVLFSIGWNNRFSMCALSRH